MDKSWQLDLGARMIEGDLVRFKVWAPLANTVAVELVDQDRMAIPMQPLPKGYFEATVEGVGPRARYRYLLDGKNPDRILPRVSSLKESMVPRQSSIPTPSDGRMGTGPGWR